MSGGPKSTTKSAIFERIANSRGPINRLRARRYGLDFIQRKPPVLEFFYEPGDPHSHLSLQSLSNWRDRVHAEIKINIVPPPRAEAYPEEEKQRLFALEDAKRIAPAWGLEFGLDSVLPKAGNLKKATRALLACKSFKELLAREGIISRALFTNDSEQLDSLLEQGNAPDEITANLVLAASEQRREHLGHYLPAMWQYDGEWFWGLDRLDHLADRLRKQGALFGPEPLAVFDPVTAYLPEIDTTQPLEFYFSFRSPYSYLAAVEVQQRFQSWPLELKVKPVLPMAMRGLPVPLEKRLYIVRDVKREADSLGIPFGRIADPIGAGAERCLNTFPLAKTTELQMAFLVTAGANIWSKGIDVATDKGLDYVCEQAGIGWPAAKSKLDKGIDLEYAESNRQDMFNAGFWGVPTFKIGNFATWGRDRIWMIDEMLRRAET